MRRFGTLAPPPKGTKERDALMKTVDAALAMDPEFKKILKRKRKAAFGKWEMQLANGAGLQLDGHLRHFLTEFNHRMSEFGFDSMPASFNVLEAFFKYDGNIFYFELLPEVDHLFSFLDYCDYLTSPDNNIEVASSLEYFAEGMIYSFNILNDPKDIQFSTSSKKSFAVGGVSMIRRGSEVSILLLGGEKIDTTNDPAELLDPDLGDVKVTPGHEEIKPSPDRIRETVKLLNQDEFWQCLILVRLDINTMTIDSRYVLHDQGDAFQITTDDISSFSHEIGKDGLFKTPSVKELYEKFSERTIGYDALFQVAASSIHLLRYFVDYNESLTYEQHVTSYGDSKPKPEIYRQDRVDPMLKIRERTVAVMERRNVFASDSTIFATNDFKIERSGYWKKLSYNAIGKDKHGKSIHGRTWVESTMTWNESPPSPLRIYTNLNQPISSGQSGIIYVMRNASHGKNIFKVGMTTRDPETRALELSSTTGSPDRFLVAQEWDVQDCVIAEKRIHKELDAYRINTNREFFKIEYNALIKIIEKCVFEINRLD